MSEPLQLREWFRTGCEAMMGFAPTSISPQPVHVLNGLLTAATAASGASAAEAISLVAQRNGGWATPADDLNALTVTMPHDRQEFDDVRRALRGLLAADGAVFTSAASLQPLHPGVLTPDPTHLRLGTVAARLLCSSPGGQAVVTELLERLCRPQPHPVWLLEDLLTRPRTEQHALLLRPPSWVTSSQHARHLATELTAWLRRAAVLAARGPDAARGLASLSTVAVWSALLSMIHLPQPTSPPQPQLVEMTAPGELPALRSAAAATVSADLAQFDVAIAARLCAEVVARVGPEPTREEAWQMLRAVEPYSLAGGSTAVRSALEELLDVWLDGGSSVVEATAGALQELLIAGMGDKPRRFFAAVGRHAGIVGPRGGRQPRWRVELQALPALVLAGIADEDGPHVPFRTWHDRLVERFGLTIGPHARTHALAACPPRPDLEANRESACRLLETAGLARRQSDGVTEVFNPLIGT